MAGSVTKGRLPKAYRTCPAARESSPARVLVQDNTQAEGRRHRDAGGSPPVAGEGACSQQRSSFGRTQRASFLMASSACGATPARKWKTCCVPG